MDTHHDLASSDAAAPPSRWARVAQDDPEALRELAGSYWYCAYSWWRRSGLEAESAAMATLASFTHWITEGLPRLSDSGGGRMREWLPARLADLAERGVKLEGDPAIAIEPAWAEDRYAEEPEGEPDTIFQRRWALTVLEFTMEAVRAEYAARGQETLFAEVSPFAGFEGGDEEHYAAAANRVGMTVGGMRKAVFDFRTRHREVLRAFVADTVADPADLDSEITALLCACDAPGATPASMPTVIHQHKPDELLARAMRTVQMSSGGAGQWTPPSDAEIKRLFPQYEMLGMLGRGGMGAVYKARQIELDRLVAIKLLPLEISVDKEFADRFRREARAMARLNHPNIIAVHDFGTTTEGHLYFAMEYVEGVNLADAIHQQGLSPEQTLSIAEQVCTALAYAHGKGIVHRDIKPANVMISTEGQVKVADFGLARLTDPTAEQMGQTMTGTVMGTPDYMAPEQMRGMNVDHRADIYSLGVMLYEMLCKEVPKGIFDPPSHRTGCDERIDQIVIKAMNSSPDRRYQSTEELKTAVIAVRTPATMVVSGATQVVHPQPVAKAALAAPKGAAMQTIAPPAAKKSKVPLYAGIAAVVLALSGAGIFLTKSKPSSVTATKDNPATPSTSAVLDPGAIKLWDTPDKLPKLQGITWDGDAIKLDKNATLNTERKVSAANVRFSASVRTNADAKYPQLWLRRTDRDNYYLVTVYPQQQMLSVRVVDRGTQKTLGQPPFPRRYGPDEWMRLTVEMRGAEVTIFVDGKALTTLNDTTLPTPGALGLYGESNAWFRDISYTLLDTATGAGTGTSDIVHVPLGKTAAAGASVEPWRDWIAEKRDVRRLGELGFDDDGTTVRRRTAGGAHWAKEFIARDGAIRATWKLSAAGADGFSTPSVQLRRSDLPGLTSGSYVAQIRGGDVRLSHTYRNEAGAFLDREISKWPLPADYDRTAEHTLELRAVGDLLRVSLHGKLLGTARDSALHSGGFGFFAAKDAAIRKIEYLSLDPAAALTEGEPWRDWIAETRTARKLEKVGFDDDGTLVRARAAMGADWPHLLTARDGAIRATWKLLPETPGGTREHYIALRQTAARGPGAAKYLALVRPDEVRLRHFQIGAAGEYRERDIARWPVPAGFDRAQEHTLELRAVGELLTVILNGKVLGTAQDNTIQEGAFAFYAAPDTAIRKMEYLSLDPATGGSAPTGNVPPTGSQPGSRAIFDGKSFSGWHGYGETGAPTGWRIQDGSLIGLGQRKTLVTDESFGDFEISLEWRVGEKGNGGIIYLIGDPESAGRVTDSPEFALQDDSLTPNNRTGSLFNGQEATKAAAKPIGEWNTAKLVSRGGKAEHWVNDQLVCSYELKSTNFSAKAGSKGKIGLQGWVGEIAYRNVRLRTLDAAAPSTPATPSTATAEAPLNTLGGTPAPAQAVSPAPSATAKWLAEQEPQWQAAFASEVSGPFEKDVTALKKQFLATIEAQLSAATKAAKLDDAVALRAERDRLAGGGEVPAEDAASTLAALKTLRTGYRVAFAKLDAERFTKAKSVHARYDAILAQSQTALTQRQRLDEALELQTKRDALTAAWLKPAAAAPTPQVAPTEVPLEKRADLKELQELEITALTPRSLIALKDATKLRILRVRGNPCRITDDDVRAIVTAAPNLQELSLGEWNAPAPITNVCVPALLGLKLPRSLELCSKGIDDAALPTIAKMRTLLELKLGGSSVNGSGLGALAALDALTNLNLRNTPITDAALDEIAKFKNLRTLDLSETNVSSAAVEKLRKGRRLQVTLMKKK